MADYQRADTNEHGPAEELAELAHALARITRRQVAMGARRTGRGASYNEAQTALNASPIGQPALSPRPVTADRVPAPRPESVPQQAPARTATPAAQPAALHSPVGRPPAPPALGPGATPDQVRHAAATCADLRSLAAAVDTCRACPLGATRKRSVFSDGAAGRRVLFVGEAPGYHEDQTGVPFVGEAGQLLTDIITKGMQLDRAKDVYICNVLKCRPPENRDPSPEEKALCTGWLDRQIELVDPLVIIALGRHAATHLLGVESALGRLRGKVHQRGGRPVVVTYHPAYLLRNPADKRACWQDIQLALRVLGPGGDLAGQAR